MDNDNQIIQQDLEEFRKLIFNKPGEYDKLVNHFKNLEESKNLVHEWNYFYNEYLFNKYGEGVRKFIATVFEGNMEVLAPFLTTDELAELSWISNRFNNLLLRIQSAYKNPLGFMSMDNAVDRDGKVILNFNRIDGQNLIIHTDLVQKTEISIALLNQAIEELFLYNDRIDSDLTLRTVKGQLKKLIERIEANE